MATTSDHHVASLLLRVLRRGGQIALRPDPQAPDERLILAVGSVDRRITRKVDIKLLNCSRDPEGHLASEVANAIIDTGIAY